MAEFDQRLPRALTGETADRAATPAAPAAAEIPPIALFTPLSQLPSQSTQKLVSESLRFDRERPNTARMLKDPSLGQFEPITQQLVELQKKFPELDLANADKRREVALWVSRNLYARALPPTLENVEGAVNDAMRDRRALHNIPLFAGRNAVVLAHAESWPQVNLDSKDPARHSRIQAIVAATHDTHRFGSRALISRLQEAVGAGQQVTLMRPELSAERRMFEMLQLNHDKLKRWSQQPGSPNYVTNAEIELFKGEIRGILGLKSGAPITLAFTVGDTPPFDLGQFAVTDVQGRLLFGSAMKLKDFRPTEMVTDRRGAPQYVLSPQRVKDETLGMIRGARPGPGGFLFIFEGHGNPDGLYLVDGQSLSSTKVHRTKDTVSITPKEFADALIDRAANFPDTHRDLYYLNECFPKDFIDRVRPLIEGKIIPPIFICQNEFGQYGYDNFTELGTHLSGELLDLERGLQSSRNRPATVGDAAERFLHQQERFRTNPVILSPAQNPENPIRPLRLLNQSAAVGDDGGGTAT